MRFYVKIRLFSKSSLLGTWTSIFDRAMQFTSNGVDLSFQERVTLGGALRQIFPQLHICRIYIEQFHNEQRWPLI